MTVVDLKEKIIQSDILSYAWLPNESMWADLLKKDKRHLDDLEDILMKNIMELPETHINEVRAFGQEVMMTNIRNRRVADFGDKV